MLLFILNYLDKKATSGWNGLVKTYNLRRTRNFSSDNVLLHITVEKKELTWENGKWHEV